MNKANEKVYNLIFILAILLVLTFNVVIANATPDKGSITLRKFDVSRYENLRESTGQASDEANLPTTAIKMTGIEFKVEKLLVEAGATSVTPETPVDNSFTARIKQTDSEGIATFADLPLGYYLVTENMPSGYISPEDGQFVVAIPITVEDSDGIQTSNYDVVVFPKNQRIQGADNTAPTPPIKNDITITPPPTGEPTTPITPSDSFDPIITRTPSSGHISKGHLVTSGYAMSAKTGDLTSVVGLSILMIASGGIIIGVIRKRRANK